MASDPPSPASLKQQQIPTDNQFSIWNSLKPHIPHIITIILVDVILPVIIYFSLQKHIQPIYALLFAGIPPFLMVCFKAMISRTFDAIGFLVFMSFIFTVLIAVMTRNPTVFLLEKSLVSIVLSFIFAITLFPSLCCPQVWKVYPLFYYFYQDLLPTKRAQIGLPESVFTEEAYKKDEHGGLISKLSEKEEVAQVYEWIYSHCSSFRFACYLLTIIWSVGLLLDFFARLTLILLHLSVTKIFLYGNIILTVTSFLCLLLTIIFMTKERKETLKFIEQWKDENFKNSK